MPSEADEEERWRLLAAEARILAADLVDEESRRELLQIAAGYELLAERAKARKDQTPG
jgi:hypothetical protein